MRLLTAIVASAGMLAAGCVEMTGDDGYLTHTEHTLTAAQRASVQAGMSGYLKVPVQLSGLRASYLLSDGTVPVCGYVSATVNGKTSPPALFAGTLSGGAFAPYKVPGQGQDPARIATVRAFCQAQHIQI